MRSPIVQSVPSLATVPSAAWQFLIPPWERIKFTAAFVLATGVGWFLTWLMLHSAYSPLRPLNLNQGLLGAFVVGLVSGTVVSASQWLVLRRYLPDWLWILAGATGYGLLMLTLEAWSGVLGQAMTTPRIASFFSQFSPTTVSVMSGAMQAGIAAMSALWLGITQWLLLRQYARFSSWWIGVPAIAVVLSSGFAALNAGLPLLQVHLPLETSVLGAGVLGITQAIALGALRKKRSDFSISDRTSALAIAPEIEDYQQVQRLGKQLHQRLNQAWISEHLNEDTLTYLVGVTESGAIAAYKSLNTPAIEQLDQIPLPELFKADRSNYKTSDYKPGKSDPLARFEVSFLPSGSLKVNSRSGLPLLSIALGMLAIMLAISAIVARFGFLLP